MGLLALLSRWRGETYIPPSIFLSCLSCSGSQRFRPIPACIGMRGGLRSGQVASRSPVDIVIQPHSNQRFVWSFHLSSLSKYCGRKPERANTSIACKLHKGRPMGWELWGDIQQISRQVISGKKKEKLNTPSADWHLCRQWSGLDNPANSLNHNSPCYARLLLASAPAATDSYHTCHHLFYFPIQMIVNGVSSLKH